jgi:hypothetical protein
MVIKRGNSTVIDVCVKASSYTNEEINGVHIAYIEFDVLEPVHLTINDYIEYFGNTYHIRYKESITKQETSLGYSYKVTFYHVLYRLHDTVLFMYDAPDFNKNHNMFRGTVSRALDLIVASMNRTGAGWTKGTVIESDVSTFDLKDKTCAEVLNDIVSEYSAEYWIEGKVINIGERQYASNGLTLKQGAGFKNLTVEAVDETPPVTRLFAYGSDQNLTADYGCDYLMLPDGEKCIEKNIDKYGVTEHIEHFEDVFPYGVFTVSEKIDNFTLRASDIDFNLADCLIDDVDVTVTFQEGSQLAGYDLAINAESWNNSTKQFTLVKNAEENALEVPGDINFAEGDTFILTGLKMPQSYIEAAEMRLQEKAEEWLDRHCENKVQLRGDCDEIYFYQNDIMISCGQMVRVVNDKLDIDREIRCTAVKRYISDGETPYRYEITLSDFLQGGGLGQIINEVKEIPHRVEKETARSKEYTKRRWADVQATLEMMFDPEGDYFTEFIKPLAVHTAQLIVGTNSQQMAFTGVRFIPNYNGDPNLFRNTSGTLDHFTVNGDGTVRTWSIPATSAVSLSNGYAYYVYARCTRAASSTVAIIRLLTDKITVDSDASYYHFLVGVLNTPIDGVRSWQPTFGYTEIAGNQITTGVIKDSLSEIVFSLAEKYIAGKIEFRAGTSGYDNITDKPDIAGAISTASTNLKNYIDGAFSDSIIDRTEAANIKAYLNILATEKADIDARHTTLYGNATLTGTAKLNLASAKTSLNTNYTNLVNNINSAISDGKITDAEAITVDTYYTSYKNALTTYSTCYEEAHNYISSKALDAAETASNAANTAASSAAGKATVYYNTSTSYVPSGVKDNDLLCTGSEIYRRSGNAWVLVSEFYNTKTVINGGLISTGALIVGTTSSTGEGGMAGGGTIRIWSGGSVTSGTTAPEAATFTVDRDGVVTSKNAFIVCDSNGRQAAGFTSYGSVWGDESTNGDFWMNRRGSLRMWVGGEYASRTNAHFKVYTAGIAQMSGIMVTNVVTPSTSDDMGVFGKYDQFKFNRTDIQCTGNNSSGDSFVVNNNTAGTVGAYVEIKRQTSTTSPEYAAFDVKAKNGTACVLRGGMFHVDAPVVDTTADILWGRSTVFVFTGTSSRTRILPTAALLDIVNDGYSYETSLEITVIQHTGSTGTTTITGSDGAPLLDNSGGYKGGGSPGQVTLSRGDCMTFRYFRGGWYITSSMT